MQYIPFLHYLHFTHLFPFLSSYPQKLRKALVRTAQVASCQVPVHFCLPPSLQLADGSLATFISIPLSLHSVSFGSPTLHYAISQPSWFHFVSPRWLKAVFPFFIYGYWIKDYEQIISFLVLVKMTSYLCCEYNPPFSQKVIYRINPAVIKSILFSMPKEEFYRHAHFIHSQSLSLPDGSNRKVMFFNLCLRYLSIHKKRFSQL